MTMKYNSFSYSPLVAFSITGKTFLFGNEVFRISCEHVSFVRPLKNEFANDSSTTQHCALSRAVSSFCAVIRSAVSFYFSRNSFLLASIKLCFLGTNKIISDFLCDFQQQNFLVVTLDIHFQLCTIYNLPCFFCSSAL